MSRKRKFERNISEVAKYLGQLTYRGLKRECVIRGMNFDDILNGSIPILTNWLHKNFNEEITYEKLDNFDDHQEKLVKESMLDKGQDSTHFFHPSLRLGYIAERDEDGNVIKRKRVRTVIKRKKKKRERTNSGIFKGTKKAYTFELQQRGYEKPKVIKMVLEKFPEASEKSIGIWFNKSRKLKK